ncbi:MAG: dimethylargininase [Chloroflexi bacterium]|nr:dimethylargininase [Chloroflexota bacterium]
MPIALTRPVSESLDRCELTYLARAPIELDLARRQHRAYQEALAELGCQVIALPEAPELPDAVFVEDLALVLDEVGILTRPGAESRRPEAPTVEEALGRYRPIRRIEPPGTLEGGDILRLGRTIYVGRSGRSNEDGIRQLTAICGEFGYEVVSVALRGCLHLKSAVTDVSPDRLLLNPAWVTPESFDGWAWMAVAPGEEHASNALRIGGGLIYPASFPRTLEMLGRMAVKVIPVDVSEIQKAEGAVTCCSLVFDERPR